MIVLFIIVAVCVVAIGIIAYLLVKNEKEEKSNPPMNATPKPKEEEPSEPVPDIDDIIEQQQPVLDKPEHLIVLDEVLKKFEGVIDAEGTLVTYGYLALLANEAHAQLYNTDCKNLPYLYQKENMSLVYDYLGAVLPPVSRPLYNVVGWLCACLFAEVNPQKRNEIFKIGYEVNDYDKKTPIYGWRFLDDPNIGRLMASVIYSGMRGLFHPQIDQMRKEIGGHALSMTVSEIRHSDPYDFSEEGAYIDLRNFMASAPGPYAPSYNKDRVTTDDKKIENGNLEMDAEIYDYITQTCNLDEQSAVQAIADKDTKLAHLFGEDRETEHYHFHAPWGKETIGMVIDPQSEVAKLCDEVMHIGSYQRSILQHNDKSLGKIEYGRCRPGADEMVEGKRKSYNDDRLNVLVNFEIEEGDGHPTGYYDAKGNWVVSGGIHNPKEYNDKMKDELWPNSYPSGHSAAAWGCCMVLCEKYPQKADVIMKASNAFAVNRTIARYHWNSDTLQGRVLSSAVCAVVRAAKDYDSWIKK